MITKIFFGYRDKKLKKYNLTEVSMSDEQLKELTSKVSSPKKVKNSFSESYENKYETPNSFYIKKDDLENNDSYHFEIFNEINYNIKNYIDGNTEVLDEDEVTFSEMTDIKDILKKDANNKTINKFVVYVFRENDDNLNVCLYDCLDNGLFKHKKALSYFTKHKGSSGIPELETIREDETLQLPTEPPIAEFKNKFEDDYTVYIYNVFSFDKAMSVQEIKSRYVDKKIDAFSDGQMKLTNDDVSVNFVDSWNNEDKNCDLNAIKKIIKNDEKLINSVSSFSGNGNCKIKRIGKDKVYNVLERLNDFVDNNENVKFSHDNIPKIKDDKIIVSKDSIPIFCALLDNSIVQKLLDGEIKIPFYN